MLVYSQICIFICMFPRGNSAQVEIPPKNISIKFKFVPIHMCYLKESSAHVRVFPLKTYQYNHKLCIHIHVFPRGKLCPNGVSAYGHIYIIINSQLYAYVSQKGVCICRWNTGEEICVNCKFMIMHTYFLKGKIPPDKDSLRTHGYKYMFI
ncbi:hypothetical protein Taro_006341, partial [Colocasia esculenta]|nr:hypothetical protein [Colocasia esculenta]